MDTKKMLVREKAHLIVDLMGEEEEYPSYYKELVTAFMKYDVTEIEKIAKSIRSCIDYTPGWEKKAAKKVKETLGVSIG